MMGVGKTTLGLALADALGAAYSDSDDDIGRLFGTSGATVAERHGVDQLHAIEAGLLYGALARPERTVITAAASVVEREPVRQAVANRARLVWVTADLDETLHRQQNGHHRRPMSREELARLTERRQPFFEAMADVVIATDRNPDVLVQHVLESFQELQN
jgi:shikimate kinase